VFRRVRLFRRGHQSASRGPLPALSRARACCITPLVAQLLAAKRTQPIRSLDDLTADTFESDEELEDFLAFTYAERHRDLA